MPVQSDFTQPRWEDATVTVNLVPPQSISGWALQFQVTKRFGGDGPLITKSANSGFNGASGITVTDGAQGMFYVGLNAGDTSGMDFGPYAYTIQRLNSGQQAALVQGYFLVMPNTLGGQ